MRAHRAEKTPIILSAPCESRRGERPLLAAHGSVRSARMPSCSHILAQPQGERAAGAVVQVVAAVAAVAMPAVGGKKRHPLAVGKPRAVKAVAVAEVAAVAMVVVAVALVAAVEGQVVAEGAMAELAAAVAAVGMSGGRGRKTAPTSRGLVSCAR